MQRTAGKRQSTQVRQEQIIDAAQKVIVRYGSEHVTVRRIAKEVGISDGAIYRHFKSKREILSLLIDAVEGNLLDDIEKSPAEGGSPLKTLDNMLAHHLSPIAQRRGVSFQVMAEIISLGDRRLNRKLHEALDNYISRIKNLLEEGVRVGEIRDDIDLDSVAMLLFSMLQGLVNIWTLSNYQFNLIERYVPLWKVLRETIIKH